MASLYSTELYVTADPRTLTEEQPLPEALRRTSLLMRVVCFLALGQPDFDGHWKSLQSEEAFETVRGRSCSILTSTITTASVLLATSVVFVTTGSPVPYFDYTSPVPHCLLLISLMLAMIALLTSGSSMIRWVHTDRHWTQEQLKPGGYFVFSYLLSTITPVFFVAWSLHCFIFGFSSQSIICRAITVVWMVTYVVNIGTILMETMWNYAKFSTDYISVPRQCDQTKSQRTEKAVRLIGVSRIQLIPSCNYLTFKLECHSESATNTIQANTKSFCGLPLSAITNKQFLCIHGGLSPELNTFDDIRAIDRFREPPTHRLMCDFLWLDTVEDFRREKMNESFVHNHVPGCSYFLQRDNLLSIIRAYEAQMPVAQQISHVPEDKNHKFSFCHDNLFSYLDVYNKAAVWSLRFVGEKITDVLIAVLNTCGKEELEESDEENVVSRVTHHEEARRKIIKNKILAVGRTARVFALIREESEKFSELKSISSKLPYGTLALGTEGMKDAISRLRGCGFTWDDNDEAPEFGEHDVDDPRSAPRERLGDSRTSWKWTLSSLNDRFRLGKCNSGWKLHFNFVHHVLLQQYLRTGSLIFTHTHSPHAPAGRGYLMHVKLEGVRETNTSCKSRTLKAEKTRGVRGGKSK
ncbi:Metallo-dependent phosphatase-like protein [Suillus subalutaceus]|uniref:Metallo-dependent phosphatase-like protein n=1 Tax=Suillus subalutaceus TaxID=48586 RepID=UPI001B86287C|nr:Metallo-dependent phosphatase-like protein [Suillus subalutaceus]KAG1849645.1 Metallo-dependent phosphatase-like protein [Suillus subalutaceus]